MRSRGRSSLSTAVHFHQALFWISSTVVILPWAVASAIVGPAHSRKTSRQQETLSRAELKSVIFSDDNRRTFSETIQAVYTDGCAHYDWEQTWLCGAITVPTLLERHVGIARLKHPANLGPQVLSQYSLKNLLSFSINLSFYGLNC